ADPARAEAYTRYIETVPPALKPLAFQLDRRHVDLVSRFPRTGDRADRYAVLDRDIRAEVSIYRDDNVPIQTELEQLTQQFLTVTFDGQERTLPQMAVYQESTDRDVRERAWRTVTERRLQDADTIESIYDKQVALRHQMAGNAGFDTFTDYTFRAMRRFDYTP